MDIVEKIIGKMGECSRCCEGDYGPHCMACGRHIDEEPTVGLCGDCLAATDVVGALPKLAATLAENGRLGVRKGARLRRSVALTDESALDPAPPEPARTAGDNGGTGEAQAGHKCEDCGRGVPPETVEKCWVCDRELCHKCYTEKHLGAHSGRPEDAPAKTKGPTKWAVPNHLRGEQRKLLERLEKARQGSQARYDVVEEAAELTKDENGSFRAARAARMLGLEQSTVSAMFRRKWPKRLPAWKGQGNRKRK